MGLVAVASLAACTDAPTVAPARVEVKRPSLLVAGTLTSSTPLLGHFIVCKGGAGSGTFSAARSAVGTGFDVNATAVASLTLAAGQCEVVVNDAAGADGGENVAITETGGGTLQSIAGFFIGINGITPITATQGEPFFINSFHGVVLTFVNALAVGNQGCTPGYWKQDQHFDSWPVSLTTTFADAGFSFGFTGTLLSGLQAKGGDVNALARHAAAAYLNSLASGVNFSLTTAEVIAIANGTGIYAGLSVEERKDLLEAANQGVGGCPLN